MTGSIRSRPSAFRYPLVVLVLCAFLFNVWGIQKNLPYIPEVDERFYWIERAVTMAASGSANPHWFGHPGSTTLYPLAAIFRLLYSEQAQEVFAARPAEFYLIGRFLGIAYATLSIPLIFLIGRKSFGARVGMMGAGLYLCYPLAVSYAQIVRSDSAAAFFGLLSLWRILELQESTSVRNQCLAGVAIGLSIASRYLMIALAPIWLIANGVLFLRRGNAQKQLAFAVIVGGLSILAAFALSTPYLFLDPKTAIDSIQVEARTTHLGADGLSRPGNLWWYLTQAIPRSITWPQYVLALAGGVIILIRRRFSQLLLLGFTLVFLLGISLSALHWDRWIIPVLPVLALMASFGLLAGLRVLRGLPRQDILLGVCAIALAIWPAQTTILHNLRDSQPSTRILARQWIIENLPPKEFKPTTTQGGPTIRVYRLDENMP